MYSPASSILNGVCSSSPRGSIGLHLYSRAKGHHLIIFGLQTAVQKLPLDAALGAFYYGALSSVTSASMKVIRIGQVACHKVLADALQRAMDVIARSKRVKREDAGWFNPLLDIASARHETAYTRLFIS